MARDKTGDLDLAKRLKELRGSKWSQEKLAEEADISLPLLQQMERGVTFGSKKTHAKLAGVLGVTVSYLVYGNDYQTLDLPPGLEETDVEFLRETALYLASVRTSSATINRPPEQPKPTPGMRSQARRGQETSPAAKLSKNGKAATEQKNQFRKREN
jgi:transcriptional regulator with XRE-family HTH domain